MKIITSKEVIIFKNNNGKEPFIEWLDKLDTKTRARVQQRILRLENGNYGDYKCLQQNLYELRFKFGSGYRVYFLEDGNKIVVLLTAGDKGSQKADIRKALEYVEEYKND